jgi:transcriptional regulator with XRE-family HTH domain
MHRKNQILVFEKDREVKKHMVIGTRLRSLREQKGMSQGDVEKATGLLRCYISRIENGHSIPSLETLERFAGALNVPLYEIFYNGNGSDTTPNLAERPSLDELAEQPGKTGEDARFMIQLKNLLAQLGEVDRDVLLTLAKKLATR